MERIDPENNKTRALFELVNLDRKHVLEVGCGNVCRYNAFSYSCALEDEHSMMEDRALSLI